MLHQARVRVRKAIVRDPLFWFFLLLCVFTGLRALNGDVACVWDESLKRNVLSGQACSLWPAHAAGTGRLQFAAVVAAAIAVEGCRLALGKAARISFAASAGVMAGISAIVHISALRCGNAGVLAMASGGEASWCGNAYGLFFLASIVATAGLFECKWNKALLLFSFAIGATGTALYLFSTPFERFAYLSLGAVAFVGCLAYLRFTRAPVDVLKCFVTVAIALIIPLTVFSFFCDPEIVRSHTAVFAEISSFPANVLPPEFMARRAELSSASLACWRSSMWLGTGIGAFPDAVAVSGRSIAGGVPGCPLNGWWQLLAERGIIGLLAVAIPFALMLFTLVRRMIGAIGRHVFLPLAVLGVAAPVAVAMDAFFACSLLRAETLIAAPAFFALAASSFPEKRRAPAGEGAA